MKIRLREDEFYPFKDLVTYLIGVSLTYDYFHNPNTIHLFVIFAFAILTVVFSFFKVTL